MTPSPRLLPRLSGYYGFVILGWEAVLIPSLVRSIEHDFHQSDAALGLLYLLRSLAYAVAALGGGYVMERLGTRAVLPAAGALAAVGLLGGALAPLWAFFILAAVMASCGHAIVDVGFNGLFLDLWSDARGGALNLLHVFFSAGALVAPVVYGVLVTVGVPWRALFGLTAAAFGCLALPLLVVRLPGRTMATRSPALPSGSASRPTSRLPFVCLAAAIALYTAAEIGVSSWLVRFLQAQPLTVATGGLSAFWFGLALGRLISSRVAERVPYGRFALGSFLLASMALAGGVLAPRVELALPLFALCGLFYGPVYPTIVAIGGAIYPHRAAAMAGGLTTASAVGTVVYPPLMGLMAGGIGLQAALLGAAALGVPGAAGIWLGESLAGRGPR